MPRYVPLCRVTAAVRLLPRGTVWRPLAVVNQKRDPSTVMTLR